MIQYGLPLLNLQAANTESFQNVGSPRLPPVPVRDRQQHAASLAQQVTVVERRLTATRTGWWEDRAVTRERKVQYSVIVSVDLGEVDIDLYSLAAVKLSHITVEIDT